MLVNIKADLAVLRAKGCFSAEELYEKVLAPASRIHEDKGVFYSDDEPPVRLKQLLTKEEQALLRPFVSDRLENAPDQDNIFYWRMIDQQLITFD